ncbi:MAG TPA: hypothetical protein IGS52_25610 [Oscillatoriaceae cyanobacterium M33_DOE_052]|nr:hypothetical protein [Oscillatoriaceae cyanobacterium M33_DOE_052]
MATIRRFSAETRFLGPLGDRPCVPAKETGFLRQFWQQYGDLVQKPAFSDP